jgi:hypothetical protein
MLAKLHTFSLLVIDALLIEVEVDVSPGHSACFIDFPTAILLQGLLGAL